MHFLEGALESNIFLVIILLFSITHNWIEPVRLGVENDGWPFFIQSWYTRKWNQDALINFALFVQFESWISFYMYFLSLPFFCRVKILRLFLSPLSYSLMRSCPRSSDKKKKKDHFCKLVSGLNFTLYETFFGRNYVFISNVPFF